MINAIIFDCEFNCIEGSQRRFWCGADDPDPVIVQIGAVKLGLEGDFPILDTLVDYITPRDRDRNICTLDPFFTKLTGITNEKIRTEGLSLHDALMHVDTFAGGARLWSWGKDELNMVAISTYVAGIPATIPPERFDNAVKLLLAAGMPRQDVERTPSNRLADYYSVDHPPLNSHDARDDALSVAYTLQHLLRSGKLQPEAFGV